MLANRIVLRYCMQQHIIWKWLLPFTFANAGFISHVVGPSCVLWLIHSLYIKLALIQCNASISRAHIIHMIRMFHIVKNVKRGKKKCKVRKAKCSHSSHTFIYQHDTFLSCHSTPSRPLHRSDYKAHHTFIAHLLFSFCHLLTVIIIIVRRLELSLIHLMRIIDVGCFLTIKLLVWLDFCLSQWYAQLPIV